MKIEDLFPCEMCSQEIHLQENYRQLKDIVDQAIATHDSHIVSQIHVRQIKDAMKRLGISGGVFEAYEWMVRKRKKKITPPINYRGSFSGGNLSDSSFWVGWFNRSWNDGAYGLLETMGFILTVAVNMDEMVSRRDDKEGRDDYKTLYRGGGWTLFQPMHRAACSHLGAGTRWCISSRGVANAFDEYASKYDVYVIHTRRDKYAVIVDSRGRLVEFQHGGNDYLMGGNERAELTDFMKRLISDGVDFDILDRRIGTYLTSLRRNYLGDV